MIEIGVPRLRWALVLGAAVVLVGLTGLPDLRPLGLVAPVAGILVPGVAGLWYWRLETRVQPEALPKLRLAGLSVLVLLLALLYGLLVAALELPAALDGVLDAILLGLAGGSVTVSLAVGIDLALRSRLAWPRFLAGLLGIGLVVLLGQRELLAEPVLDSRMLTPILGLGFALLAIVTPMEWIVELDRRQRLAVLAGWGSALVPVGVTIGVDRFLDLPGHTLLIAYTQYAALLLAVFLAVVFARATLALPGARAYERKTRELDAVYDFGLTAGSAFDPERLADAVLDAMFRVVEPTVAVMVVPRADGPGCHCVLERVEAGSSHRYRFNARTSWSSLGERFADRRPVMIADHKRVAAGRLERIWEPTEGSSVIVPVIGQGDRLRAVLIVGRFEHHGFNAAEARSLAGFASQVALALEHAHLLRETVESERRKRELEIARELQMNLLPDAPPEVPGLDIADRAQPATEVGGDYFDYLMVGEDSLAIVVGDVSGHGMPAGLMMAMAKSAVHTQLQFEGDPSNLMGRLSETLLRMSADNQFMTMVLAQIDVRRGRMRYANAGHHYPLHYRAETGRVEQLESTGLPLGLLPRPTGPFRTVTLGAGDLLVFYTDGLVEAPSAHDPDEIFGITRLSRVVLANRDRGADALVSAVFRAVKSFTGDAPLHDDATIVVVRVRELGGSPPAETSEEA